MHFARWFNVFNPNASGGANQVHNNLIFSSLEKTNFCCTSADPPIKGFAQDGSTELP